MQGIVVDLSLSREQCESWYAGDTRYVQARSRDGRSVRFPVAVLRKYLDHSGVHGSFAISFDEHRRFQSIRRVV